MNFSLKQAYNTLRNVLIAPNRMEDYKAVLLQAKAAGYTFYTLGQFAGSVRTNAPVSKPFLILRHDIDTDCATALRFAYLEYDLGIKASYYFRLSTWKLQAIKEIAAMGHETGYHYEELATYAKQRHQKDSADLLAAVPVIRKNFAANLSCLRRESGLSLVGFASHGDFANVRLDLTNRPLLADPEFRAELGVDYEAYDNDIQEAYGLHVSDKPYPEVFHPASPQSLVNAGMSFLLLTHPRWWKLNLTASLRESCKRLWEELIW